ncbi:MAG: hypothetical protein ABI718_16880 [Acidobacteriota bacterium]
MKHGQSAKQKPAKNNPIKASSKKAPKKSSVPKAPASKKSSVKKGSGSKSSGTKSVRQATKVTPAKKDRAAGKPQSRSSKSSRIAVPAEITFASAEVGDAYRLAVKKYPAAFKKLSD